MKTISELCKDSSQFLMLYGDVEGESKQSARRNRLGKLLSAPSLTALRSMQDFLMNAYGDVAGTALTGADGLDMDEAYAARLYREIDALLQEKP